MWRRYAVTTYFGTWKVYSEPEMISLQSILPQSTLTKIHSKTNHLETLELIPLPKVRNVHDSPFKGMECP